MAGLCEVSQPAGAFSCTAAKSTATITIDITLASASPYEFRKDATFIVSLYFSSAGGAFTPTTGITYSVVVRLPSQVSGADKLFGNAYASSNAVVLAQCSNGQFLTSQYPLGTEMSIDNLKLELGEQNARSSIEFTFRSVSQRAEFHATSTYVIDFGFLADNNQALLAANNFRCLLFEKTTVQETRLSWKWKTLSLGGMSAATLTPKASFSSPDQYTFMVRCYGGSVPNSGASTGNAISVKWMDTAQLQVAAAPIQFAEAGVITLSKPLTGTHTLQKLFASEGFEAFYTFSLSSTSALNHFSKIYIELPFGTAAKGNSEQSIECYIRISGQALVNTICEMSAERRIKVWINNQIEAGTAMQLDVYGITQPASGQLKTDIWIGIDDNAELSDGLLETGFIADTQPISQPITPLLVTHAAISSSFIRSQHSIALNVSLPAATVVAGQAVYLELLSDFARLIERNFVPGCQVLNVAESPAVNYASSCQFISKKRLKIVLATDAANAAASQTYAINVTNIPTPFKLPDEVKNAVQFLVFLAAANEESITHLGVRYRAPVVSYELNSQVTALQWNIYEQYLDLTGSVVNGFLGCDQQVDVFVGYFKRTLELVNIKGQTFDTDFDFHFPAAGELFALRPNASRFAVQTGYGSTKFDLAAQRTTSPGIYIIQGQKLAGGDIFAQYSEIPPILAFVRKDQCLVNAAYQIYYIPTGGQSLPIILDFFNCFPVDDIAVAVSFDPDNLLQTDDAFQSSRLNSSVASDTRIIFTVREKTGVTLTPGQQVKMAFDISGTNSPSYLRPDNLTLVAVDPISGNTPPRCATTPPLHTALPQHATPRSTNTLTRSRPPAHQEPTTSSR